MSGEDMDAIRKRADSLYPGDYAIARSRGGVTQIFADSARDVPALLAVLSERDEQIAALQAVIAEAKGIYDRDDDGPIEAGMYTVLSSAPSDTLARVKREAAADALEAVADETYTHTTIGQKNERTKRQVPVLPETVRDHLRFRAASIRTGATS